MYTDKNKMAIALVGDFKYLYKHFNNIYKQIRNVGNYEGQILVITTYLCPTLLLKKVNKSNKVKVLRFRKIKFNKVTNHELNNLETFSDPNRNKTKKFQWHKLHLFDTKLKEWNFIFYLDLNMTIHYDLNPILKQLPHQRLLARADSYPKYDRLLETQFDKTNSIFEKLSLEYDLTINNYFQTGILFFDTKIINKDTKRDIFKIVHKYPISITNEQGILNLYFLFEKKVYEELRDEVGDFITYFYWMLKDKKVIITKAINFQNK